MRKEPFADPDYLISFKIVYILHGGHKTPTIPVPKMQCKDAKTLQKNRLSVCTMRLVMHRLWTVQKRQLMKMKRVDIGEPLTDCENVVDL